MHCPTALPETLAGKGTGGTGEYQTGSRAQGLATSCGSRDIRVPSVEDEPPRGQRARGRVHLYRFAHGVKIGRRQAGPRTRRAQRSVWHSVRPRHVGEGRRAAERQHPATRLHARGVGGGQVDEGLHAAPEPHRRLLRVVARREERVRRLGVPLVRDRRGRLGRHLDYKKGALSLCICVFSSTFSKSLVSLVQ